MGRILHAVEQAVSTALARGARSYASDLMARQGFVVVTDFISAEQAARIRHDVERFGDRSLKRTGVAGTELRDRADRQAVDLNVRQLTGAEHLSGGIADLVTSGRLERELARLTGFGVHLGGMTVQVDWPDTETKRGLHVDSHWPPTYKAFVYLTPVTDPGNGPLSVVPGSHRDRVKKVRAVLGDLVHHRRATDLWATYRMDDATPLCGPPGTAIFADQRLAHAGWPRHTDRTRIMLVAYLFRDGDDAPSFLRPGVRGKT